MQRIGVVVVSWLLVLLGSASAAEHRGTIRGHISHGGGPLAGARLKVESESTGEVRTTAADGEGRFTVTELDPGSYRVSVEGDEYRDFFARTEVRSNETTLLELDASLPSVSTAVDFRPYFQFVDRSSPWFRTRFDAPLLAALPLDGRNIADLAALTPGVTTTVYGPLAAGTLPASTGYLVDGVALFDPLFGTALLPVLPESIVEMSILTPPLDARFGRSAGAQVNVVTRSGTNEFRGTALTFYQWGAERLQMGGLVGGPLRRNSTFLFGDLGYTSGHDLAEDADASTQASGRLDQVTGNGRLTARYGFSRGGPVDRRGSTMGISYVHQISDRVTNDARFGFARMDFGDRWSGVLPEFDSIEAANVVTWSTASHVVSGGAEYFSFAPGAALVLADERTFSAFVQDQWRASARLSVTGGVRFDRISRDPDLEDDASTDDSMVSPRAGVVWALGEDSRHLIRGDYGRHLQVDGSGLDAWSVGVQRQWGRIRTLEVGYLGTRTDDAWSGFGADARYDGVRVQLQQRSETALSTHASYTYGRWTIASENDERVRASLDSRHKLTAAFVWRLPFGDEGLLFTDGFLERIFGDLQVAGIAVTQSGRPRINRAAPAGPPWRTVDLAVMKTVRFGASALEVRAEVFNVSNRRNPVPALLGTGFEELFFPSNRERRWQVGGRLRF